MKSIELDSCGWDFEIDLKDILCTLSEPSVNHWAASVAGRLCGSGRSGGPLQPMRSSCGRSPHPLVQTVAYQPSWPILTHPPLLILFPLFLLLHLFLLLLAGMAHTESRLQQALHIRKYIRTIVIPLCCTNKMTIVKTTAPIYHPVLVPWGIVGCFSANKFGSIDTITTWGMINSWFYLLQDVHFHWFHCGCNIPGNSLPLSSYVSTTLLTSNRAIRFAAWY